MSRNKFIDGLLVSVVSVLCVGVLQSGPAMSQGAGADAFLSEHNTVRAIHHSPALTSNSALESNSQSYADYLLESGVFLHSDSEQRDDAGENFFYTYSQHPLDPAELAARAVNAWYEEVEDYDYNRARFSIDTGHFAQVVWKSTTQLGCGIAQGPRTIAGRNGTINYVVCHYSPAGNVDGDYESNVLQP